MACFDVCPSLETTTFFEATSVSTEFTPAIFSLNEWSLLCYIKSRFLEA